MSDETSKLASLNGQRSLRREGVYQAALVVVMWSVCGWVEVWSATKTITMVGANLAAIWMLRKFLALPPMALVTKRRWFRFSLRTMFVLVTVVACCVGWLASQLSWARQRHRIAYRDDVTAYGAYGRSIPDAPWPIRWCEHGYAMILLHHEDGEREKLIGTGPDKREKAERLLQPSERTEMDWVRSLFPEAEVTVSYLPCTM